MNAADQKGWTGGMKRTAPDPVPADNTAEGESKPQEDEPTDNEAATLTSLLHAMQAGDREAAARFIMTYGSRVRRRIRGKLEPNMRRLFDSQEILSTVGRRLDLYVRAGRLDINEERQLWSLIFRMADNALIDKARVFRRLRKVEDSDSTFARDLLARLESAEQQDNRDADIEIDHALRELSDAVDRQILSLWLIGHTHSEIGEIVDLAPTAIRKRWQNIKSRLRAQYESDHGTDSRP